MTEVAERLQARQAREFASWCQSLSYCGIGLLVEEHLDCECLQFTALGPTLIRDANVSRSS
jgi:hypothetical protein